MSNKKDLPLLQGSHVRNENREGTNFPTSIDINPTAKCNLNCSFCWGPNHSIEDGLSTTDWENVLMFFASRGTTSVVFTGGEPLIRRDIGSLAMFAKHKLGMHVTLSTNTLLLKRKASEVLPHVDEIGVPLDGSTPERNNLMRLGTVRHFSSVIETLPLLDTQYPHIHVTVRTVVSKVNSNDILSIGSIVKNHSHEIDRWKIYQFNPMSYGEQNIGEHHIGDSEFGQICQVVRANYGNLPIHIYPAKEGYYRYVFIGSEGNVYGENDNGKYAFAGNILTSSTSELLQGISEIFNPRKNSYHAQE